MYKRAAEFTIFTVLAFLAFTTVTSVLAVTYTIADPTGDWGYPSLYGMYPRGPGYVRMSLIFDTLVWKDKGGIIPALAESWVYMPEKNAYIFNLRQDVTWHDGKRFTATDVVFTLNYIKQHPWEWVDSNIVKEAEEIDEYVVEIYLSKPYAPFLTNVAGTLPVIPKHVWEGVEKPDQFMSKEALIGTGPYRLADYNKAQGTYLYEAYEGYYLGKPKVDTIGFVKVNTEMAPTALKKGEVNASSVPPEILDELRSKGLEIAEEPPTWAAKLIINHKKEPLSSKEFRSALAYAIDREKIVRIAKRGHAVSGSMGLIPPSNRSWHNPNVRKYAHDVTRAKSIIDDMGYTMDKDGYYHKDDKRLEFELLAGSVFREEFSRIGELIKSDLEEVGVKINLRGLESKVADARIKNWNFDLAVGGHGGLGGDPVALNRNITGEGFNSARYFQNEELVTLLKKQLQEMDIEKRKQTVYRIQNIYAQELPAITLYHPKWYWAHDGTVDIYYTDGGLALGIPIPINKLSFLEYHKQR
jgi:peptide/nickel transport system substrate-binding protein